MSFLSPFRTFLLPAGPFFGISQNFQWPYSYQFNFSVQRQVAANFSLSSGDVGTLSHDLPFAQDINAPATGVPRPSLRDQQQHSAAQTDR